MAELRETLADSFCNDRRLANLEKRFHEEVLEPYGGLAAVMRARIDSRNDVFQNSLFERVASHVDEWLKNSDAASILYQWYGSIDAVVEKLIETAKSTILAQNTDTVRRLIVCLPGSPSGRSLRESLEKLASELPISDSVSITRRRCVVSGDRRSDLLVRAGWAGVGAAVADRAGSQAGFTARRCLARTVRERLRPGASAREAMTSRNEVGCP